MRGNDMESTCYYESPIGTLKIIGNDTAITQISLDKSPPLVQLPAKGKQTSIIQKTIGQLEEYFTKKRKSFDIPLDPMGTPFQKRVWMALGKIPYGKTQTYKQIAEVLGSPKAARAVGLANNRNPIMIVIPCHRVIGANGSLVGYAGGLDVKEKLLILEEVLDKRNN